MWGRKEHTVWLYLFYGLLMIGIIQNKHSMHIDEVFSYGLANCQNGVYIHVEDGYTYCPADIPWIRYMTTDEENRFDYVNVWLNQMRDVHPPFYYFLLHTICSFFPGRFSIWHAGLINIMSGMGILFYMRKLILLLTGDKKIRNLISIVFICSTGNLSAVAFLRMYMLAMLWVTVLTYLLIRQLIDPVPKGFYGKWCVIMVCASLTHYYCIVYSFFLCTTYAYILFFIKKNRNDVKRIVLAQGVSLMAAVLIFWPMICHVLFSSRGRESILNLTNFLKDGVDRISAYFEILNRELWGGVFIYVLCVVILSAVINKYRDHSAYTKQELLASAPKWLCIGVPVILYFLLISVTASFISDRYMFPMYAVLFLTANSAFSLLLKRITKKHYIFIITISLVIMTVNGWNGRNIEYLYEDRKPLLDTVSTYTDTDCIFIYDKNKPWELNSVYHEIAGFDNVTFFDKQNLSILGDSELLLEDHLLLVIASSEGLDRDDSDIDLYKYLGGFEYTKTYYLYSSHK